MIWRRRSTEIAPWWFAAISILVLLLALATVGIFGVLENTRLQDASEQAIRLDVAVAGTGDDIRVDVSDLRFSHRNIVFSGPTDPIIAEFDESWTQLMAHIDQLEQIDVSNLDVAQPDELRALAQTYHDQFRPSIVLFTSDPVTFNKASAAGLDQLNQLESMAQGINAAGNQMTGESLRAVSHAAQRERIILLSLLVGVALIGIWLSVAAGRVFARLRMAHATELAASRQLESTLRAKTDFIADASHELRTPLTLIRGNAELGQTATDPESQAQLFSEIVSESTRMSHLVNDLLFLARSDAGSAPVELEYVPARWLAERLVTPAEALVRSSKVPIAVTIDAQGHLEADPDRIQQAVLILIDNAVRFTPAGEGIALAVSEMDGNLQIAVTDHGPGVPWSEQPLIFERFYQTPQTNARQRGGAGLGLSIARSIVDAHNGSIAIDSEPGLGATITIRLPLIAID